MTPQDALELLLHALHDSPSRAEALAAMEACTVLAEALFKGCPYNVDVPTAVQDAGILDEAEVTESLRSKAFEAGYDHAREDRREQIIDELGPGLLTMRDELRLTLDKHLRAMGVATEPD